ncbi:two-component system, sensor histidine kinase RegB [Yoonia tamlensis]|uniref:histidine kinase n=1 Tax=Yoonia tamlensis TaxID=390270 RepID=A0A1I6HGV8_9RHOB|nr:ActS/PrrB/RegB family redox-sensitive histidine kinase [Yoonia tamlensis]SFR53691.1 two-component system, sensor histidine kinase RegB [Yoonia tamlensis]
MSVSDFRLFQQQQRSNWIRLRTLTSLRWVATMGQVAAIMVASLVYGVQIHLGLAAAIIGVSVLANLVATVGYPENTRLSERGASLWLVFDLIQLGLLLGIAGGLNNPFAMLMLAPVTIAATVLHLNTTVLLGLTAIAIITTISQLHMPIVMFDGSELLLPIIFQFGFWASIVIGIVFLSVYARQVTTEMHAMREALGATQLALAREQKLTDLGGVVAAAAHELGTPLATIKLVASEMKEELGDHPDLYEDATLIGQQADRCRDILHSMGRAGKDDLLIRHAPIEAILREAAEPHMERGKHVQFQIDPSQDQPTIARRPEIIHGLRNLIQNAVDFAQTEVRVDVTWTDVALNVRIADDGPGFPGSVIGRIGDPYVRRRRNNDDSARPGYKGMGLGLFIAKTLLERSGAQLTFANSRRAGLGEGGAVIDVAWARDALPNSGDRDSAPLGENQQNSPET